MVQYQQFSTPLALAWVAGFAANIQPGELVLEPSAGTRLFDGTSKDGLAQKPLGEVLEVLAGKPGPQAADRRAFLSKRLPEILDAMHIGFEPDKRFGPAPTLSDDTMLCLFEMAKPMKAHQDCDEYRSARTMVEIAVLAAKADDQVVDAEMSVILEDVAQIAGLDSSDHHRLRAHAQALASNPSKMRAATTRLLALPEAEKDRVLTTAVRAILADQRVLPSEVRFLEGLYKSLGKSQDEVYARLHAGVAHGNPPMQAVAHIAGRSPQVVDIGNDAACLLNEWATTLRNLCPAR